MVARKRGSRVGSVKHKEKNLEISNPDKEVEGAVNDTHDEGKVAVQKKAKLHSVQKEARKSKRQRGKRKGQCRLRRVVLLKGVDTAVVVSEAKAGENGQKAGGDKRPPRKSGLGKMKETFPWGITLTGIPKDGKELVQKIIDEYEEFNVAAYDIMRQCVNKQISQILYLYFDNQEHMKNAVFSGPKEFSGKSLTLRTHPEWSVYVPGVPFDAEEEAASLALRRALGPAVYHVAFPRQNDRLMGYAVAYVVDHNAAEELTGKSLHLWGKEQCVCTEQQFFGTYVLHVLSGLKRDDQECLIKIEEKLKKKGIEFFMDPLKRKIFFLDESSLQKVFKKSGMMVQDKKIIFSRSKKVSFVLRSIARSAKKDDILELLRGIQVFNLSFNKDRCKATFDVRVEDVEKCKELHGQTHLGRSLEVFECGSEEHRQSKEMSRMRFQNILTEKKPLKMKGKWVMALAKHYRKEIHGQEETAKKKKRKELKKGRVVKKTKRVRKIRPKKCRSGKLQ